MGAHPKMTQTYAGNMTGAVCTQNYQWHSMQFIKPTYKLK
jgi:hypothetical protein